MMEITFAERLAIYLVLGMTVIFCGGMWSGDIDVHHFMLKWF